MKKTQIFFFVLCVSVFWAFGVAFAQNSGNASLTLVKDLQNGLFTLTMSDSQGIASFSLMFAKKTDKLPYSGDFAGCPTRKVLNNNAAVNDSDLAEGVKGKIIDCQGSETEFEISSVDAKGKAQVKKLGTETKQESVAPSATTPAQETQTAPAKQTAEVKASEIIFPVPELGNCEDKENCFAYCELPENGKKCLEFAKKHGLLPEDEIRVAEKVLGVKGGPGGCNSKKSCEAYCNDIDRIDECVAFAEENGLMKGKELEEAKKVRAAVQQGIKMPGGCKNKNTCQNYCENPDNMDECLSFAEKTGMIPPEELEQAKKFLPLMKSGQTPGGCKSKDQCEAYCESDEHFEECITFAEKNGMIPEEEREHIEAFKKAGGRGPGGCRGRQCQAFCENPENQEACFNWAKENGMMREEDVQRMEEGRQQIEKMLEEAPPEVVSCIEEALGAGGLEKMRSGGFFGGPAIGEKMRTCFESFMSQMGGEFGGEHGGPERGNFSGPGGCQGPDECMAYCKENPEECQNFGPRGEENGNFEGGEEHGGFPGGGPGGFGGPSSGGPGGLSGPGGCSSPTECQAYCQENPEDCEGFGPPSGGPGEFPGMGEEMEEFEGMKGGFPPSGEFHPPEGMPENFNQEFQKQGAEQFQQQYQQQYQQEFQKQYEQQYQQQYQQQMQQQTPPPTSSVMSPLGLVLTPLLWLIR